MIRTITIHEVGCDSCPRTLSVTSLVRLLAILDVHGWAVVEGEHVCKVCLEKREKERKE